ncbi:MAG: S-formylglutathione hydrolase [Woeseiaceae bacterium]|nr:S-formylglutathione hydrolase [Woeseiaceae bacterium]NIP19560.1 S-formylglutathione hydrolase [Woeseiaceae bacterium]NIS88514.1 S-formylglutathione hydrolase [Woeseiaceae bacterium]
MTIDTINETRCFGGTMGTYRHASSANNCDMQFAVFVPPQAADGNVPVVTFLSGLTCTEENFMTKSGAQRYAAELGVMLVAPDTSPRGEGVPDDADGSWDFGLGAGFYLNATEEPWSEHYHMYDYVMQDLQHAVFGNFPGDAGRQGLTGHSMGGHGALTIGLKHPDVFRSLSAFAPISTTLHSPWGRKALGHYLGGDTSTWTDYDASEVARNVSDPARFGKILVDQGEADPFLTEQLQPERLQAACAESGLSLELRRHQGYDHGYYFISTFIGDHLKHHREQLDA